jgi:hypothetical protein
VRQVTPKNECPSNLDTRIRAYVAKLPAAINGAGGCHVATLKAATCIVVGFNRSIDEARPHLLEYNQRCEPPWSRRDLEHKLTEAAANKRGLRWGYLLDDQPHQPKDSQQKQRPPPAKKLSAEEQKKRWQYAIETKLDGFEADPYDLWEASPIRLLDDYSSDARLAISCLSEPDDLINVNCKYRLKADGRPDIVGSGVTRSAAEWADYLADNPAPRSEAGCWWRHNPVKAQRGAGWDGCFTDLDIATFRYHLFEIDAVPMELQLSFLCKIQAPIAMITDSGGKSYHALVKSSAKNLIEYQAEASFLFDSLFTRYGVDFHNRNPSRTSRLPGVPRIIGARTLLDGEKEARQKILYLNPRPEKGPIL